MTFRLGDWALDLERALKSAEEAAKPDPEVQKAYKRMDADHRKAKGNK